MQALGERKIGNYIGLPVRTVLPPDPLSHRCARNCFLCPSCKNTLIVVPSDPPESPDGRIMSINTLGDPPFFLYCSHCRWDSAEVGITFEKPTSLASACSFTEVNP